MTRAPRIALLLLVASLLAPALHGCSDNPSEPPPGPYGVIETYAGDGLQGLGADGLPPARTSLYWPQDIGFGPDGKVYILDWNNHRVRVVENGVTHTLCGTGYLGDAPAGPATEISLNHPTHVTFDSQGNVIMSAWHNSKVIHIDLQTGWAEPIAGTGARSYSGDGGPAVEADLDLPVACLVDDEGRLLIMDQANQCIRRVTNGLIDTFAGTPTVPGFAGDGGPPSGARFNFPTGQAAPPSGRMALGADGTIYIADTGNNRIRILAPQSGLPGAPSFAHDDYLVSTIAGNGAPFTEENRGFAGENVPALEAQLDRPGDVDVDSQGNVYIADTFNHCIRKVDVNGVITTFAGTPNQNGFGGDGGDPRRAKLDRPYGIAVDANDNVFIADMGNNRVRVIWKDPAARR